MKMLFRNAAALRPHLLLLPIVLLTAATFAQIPAPKDVLGFTPGDDRKLAAWGPIVEYFKRLDVASDRVIFQEIGKSTMGAPFVYSTISSPANLLQLKKYEDINSKLADPRKIGGKGGNPTGSEGDASREAAAKRLIAEGKTIVLITCGIHSTEVGSTLSSMLIAHRLASGNEPEIKKILDNTIILLVPSLNPDGVDIVKNWYDKTLGTPYEGTAPPELYHKYVGHDDNRDWYAFTQVETQLTVDHIHNVWHPQIVHDIHQQGANGSRLFLPPYMQPVEPNVPKQIVDGYTELGNFMAAELRKDGFQGITTNSTYDAWTPARAYSHYHGGVRILSETASAKLATPVTVNFDQLRPGLGYDPRKEAENFGPVWKGGEWHLRDITHYMTSAAFTLLDNAANERERWLKRFYEIGKQAVTPRKAGQLTAFVIPDPKANSDGTPSDAQFRRKSLINILKRAGVEMRTVDAFTSEGKRFPADSVVIPMAQPYGGFAKAMLEPQSYPHLLDRTGNPIPPYDVTAHTLSLLMDVPAIPLYAPVKAKTKDTLGFGRGCGVGGSGAPRIGIYRSEMGVMDEGWTRWVFEQQYKETCNAAYRSVSDKDIRAGNLALDSILFPDQSPNQMLNGYQNGSMPPEYTGGIGKNGVESLKKFVAAGGTLVFLNRSSNFAIDQFELPIKDVTKGIARKDFFIPGSILRTELDTGSPIAKNMSQQSVAWFENGPAFEIAGHTDGDAKVKVIARYSTDPKQILLSGWALGAEKIAGKAALVEVTIGKGKVILFGFRPQYRAQSSATYPLMFNALSH